MAGDDEMVVISGDARNGATPPGSEALKTPFFPGALRPALVYIPFRDEATQEVAAATLE
jgi:hypothetical protein